MSSFFPLLHRCHHALHPPILLGEDEARLATGYHEIYCRCLCSYGSSSSALQLRTSIFNIAYESGWHIIDSTGDRAYCNRAFRAAALGGKFDIARQPVRIVCYVQGSYAYERTLTVCLTGTTHSGDEQFFSFAPLSVTNQDNINESVSCWMHE